MKKIRILLADDHMLMRMGLSTLIACEEDMTIVGEAKNGQQAVELAYALKPDIVIMDLMMPELSGAAATKLIHDAYPEIKERLGFLIANPPGKREKKSMRTWVRRAQRPLSEEERRNQFKKATWRVRNDFATAIAQLLGLG